MTEDVDPIDDVDDLPDDPKESIERINATYRQATPGLSKGSIQGGGEFARSGFDPTHFPLELIQNADDEDATDILFEYDSANQQLRVFDDGSGFDAEGVLSVCQQGQSRKQTDREIGFMGIGFKSLFEICDRVEIHSKEYHFAFDLGADAVDDDIPSFLLPEWVDTAQAPAPRLTSETTDDYTTAIIGQVSADEQTVLSALENQNLSPSVFLFLNSLERARVRTDGSLSRTLEGEWDDATTHTDPAIQKAASGYTKHLKQDDIESDLADPVQIRNIIADGEEQSYVLFRNIWEPGDVSRPQFREDLDRSELFVALRYDEEGLSASEGSIRLSPVHSYLPISSYDDVAVDFLLHADFDLTLNRDDVQRNNDWNEAVVEALYKRVLVPVAHTVAQHNTWHETLEVIVPAERNESDSSEVGLIEGALLGEYTKHLRGLNLFQPAGADSPKLVPFEDAVATTDAVLEVFNPETVHTALDKWPVVPSQRLAYTRLDSGTSDQVTVSDVLCDIPIDVLKQREPSWFQEVYWHIADNAYGGGDDAVGSDDNWAGLRDIREVFSETGIPTLEGGLKQWSGRYNWNSNLRLPPEKGYDALDGEVMELTSHALVHPDVLAGERGALIRSLFEKLGADVLSPAELLASAHEDAVASMDPERVLAAYVQDNATDERAAAWLREADLNAEVANRLLTELREVDGQPDRVGEAIRATATGTWKQLSPKRRRATLQYLQETNDATDSDLEGINSLPARGGGWSPPERLVFSEEYQPRYDFEWLQAEYPTVFDEHTAGFVDPSLIDDAPDGWREFLQAVGVCPDADDEHSIVSTLSGYVGQAFAAQWLRDQGVEPTRTDIRGENVGWDIEDVDGNHYEVKSTVNSRHNQIRLDGRQFEELEASRGAPQEYYVIAVVNSLDDGIAVQDCATADEIMAAKGSIEYDPADTHSSFFQPR